MLHLMIACFCHHQHFKTAMANGADWPHVMTKISLPFYTSLILHGASARTSFDYPAFSNIDCLRSEEHAKQGRRHFALCKNILARCARLRQYALADYAIALAAPQLR